MTTKKQPAEGEAITTIETESQLRASLQKSGLPADRIERMVQLEVAEGTVKRDSAASISVKALKEAGEELKKGLALLLPDATEAEQGVIAKGDTAVLEQLAYTESLGRVTSVNTEALLDYTKQTTPAIMKGLQATGEVIQQLLGVIGSLQSEMTLMKGLIRDPRAPKGLSAEGAQAFVPHPSEVPAASAEDVAKGAQEGKVLPMRKTVDPVALRDALRAQHRDLIKKGGDEATINEIGSAIGALEAGVPVPKVIKDYSISVGS